MKTTNPRVQVTVDPELQGALESVDPEPSSRSRLIRDLALRGAHEVAVDQQRQKEAAEFLCKIADGEVEFDFAAAREVHEERERSITGNGG